MTDEQHAEAIATATAILNRVIGLAARDNGLKVEVRVLESGVMGLQHAYPTIITEVSKPLGRKHP